VSEENVALVRRNYEAICTAAALGHAVIVETRIVGRGRGSDVPIEADETDVFWFRDGMIVRLQGFATKDEALEAARSSAG
jgi:hypothetical protein